MSDICPSRLKNQLCRVLRMFSWFSSQVRMQREARQGLLQISVDEAATKLDEYVPLPVKQVSCEAFGAAQKVPEVAKFFVSEVQQEGVVVASKSFYTKYEPLALEYIVKLYHALYGLPLFLQVAEFVIPTAARWSEKYNGTISHMRRSGFPLVCYLPLVPVSKIAETFEGKKKKESGEMQSIAESSD